MDFNTILNKFSEIKKCGNQYKAICPAHDDKEASLSITHVDDKTLINCFAGCETKDILKAVGLNQRDLFDEEISVSKYKNTNGYIEIASYKYIDLNGKIIFEKVRYSTNKKIKNFTIVRCIDGERVYGIEECNYYESDHGSHRWYKNAKEGATSKYFEGVEPILYNLPRLIEGVNNNSPIFIVEGEKDVDNLTRLGIVATCNFDGASKSKQKTKWRECYNQHFSNARVIIIPDNDPQGISHAKSIASSLKGIAKEITYLELPGLAEKQDTSDWLGMGNTKEDLFNLISSSAEENLDEVQPEDDKKGIFESNNSYCKYTKYGIKELTNFIIEPLELIEGTNTKELLVNIITNKGKVIPKKLNVECLMGGYQKFKNSLGELLIFDGKDTDLEGIKRILLDKDFKKKIGVEQTGFQFHKNKMYFVSGDKTIDKVLDKSDDIIMINKNLELDTDLLNYEPINKEELVQISRHLFKFNTLSKTAVIIGTTASIFLKEVLKRKNIKFHHLLIFGERGSGKSQTVDNIIRQILGCKQNPEACGQITRFTLLKMASSSNFVPLILEEYKPEKMDKYRVNEISNLQRDLYDGHTGHRGSADLSMRNYSLSTPLILVGEVNISEPAILERSLEIDFCKKDLLDEEISKSFNFLKDNKGLLHKLGRALLNEVFLIDERLLLQIRNKTLSTVPKEISDIRIRENIANCSLGIYLLRKVYERLGLSIEEATNLTYSQIITAISKTTYHDLLNSNSGSKSVVCSILETFDRMALQNILLEEIDYKVNGKEIILNLATIYDKFLKYHKTCGLSIEKYDSTGQFVKVLKKEPFFKCSRTSRFKVYFDNSLYKPVNSYVLDREKLKELNLELSIFIEL